MYSNLKLGLSVKDSVVVFAETEPGFFGATVDSTDSTRVETSGSTMQVAAVSTVDARYVSQWYLSGSYSQENYGLVTLKDAGGGAARYPSSTSMTSAGCKVSVVNEHGTHLGTPTGSGMRFNASPVGVRHLSTDAGWSFTGWRVTFSGPSSYGRILSTGYTKNGNVYEFPADYAAAVVFKCGSSSSYEVIFEAVYEQSGETVTLVYDAAGGMSTPESQSAISGTSIVLAGALERDGYNFAGWLINGKIYAAGSEYTLSANVTAVAQWSQEIVYSVAFNKAADGVDGPAIPSIVVAAGGAVILPGAPLWLRENYVFVGWSTMAGGGLTHAEGTSFMPTADVVFYAVWAAVSGDGARADAHTESTPGAWNTDISALLYYNFLLSVNIPQKVSVGYWTCNQSSLTTRTKNYAPNNNPNPIVTETRVREQGPSVTGICSVGSATALTIPGDWISYHKYEIMYHSYGSQTETHREEIYRTNSGSDWVWTAPEVENYEFDGWYTISQSWSSPHSVSDSEFVVKIGSDPVLPWSDLVNRCNYVCTRNSSTSSQNYEGTDRNYTNYVRLRYVGKRVLVLFDAAGGDLDDFYRQVRFSEAYGALPIPTRSGYTFAGWFTEAGDPINAESIVQIADDHVLYARWAESAGQYKLYFDTGSGTSPLGFKVVTEGLAVGELPVAARPGWTFDGWWTLPIGGDHVTAETPADDSDSVVYAHWIGAEIVLMFDPAGGSCEESGRSVTAGMPVGELPIPVRPGMKFGGWVVGGEILRFDSVLTASAVAVATWTEMSSPTIVVRYKIHFELDGGVLDPGYECKYTRGYAKQLPTAAEVSRDGSSFVGWYKSADFAGEAVTEIPATATGSQRFFAKWV